MVGEKSHTVSPILTWDSAICLSTLHTPSPPEPAKLSKGNEVAEGTARPPSISSSEQEEILRLKECGHEFHAECLISWVVLNKKSCPICRTIYYHEESEKPADIEAQTLATTDHESAPAEPTASAQRPVTNWRYFRTGRDTTQQHTHPIFQPSWQRFRSSRH